MRRSQRALKDCDFVIGEDAPTDPAAGTGTTPYWGRMLVTDAEVARRRVAAMIGEVCNDDPRTQVQLRAAAFAAIMAGAEHLGCECGDPACPPATDRSNVDVVVHVLTDQQSLDAIDQAAEDVDEPGGPEQQVDPVAPEPSEPDVPSKSRKRTQPAAILLDGTVVPAPLLAALVARGARIKPLVSPPGKAESRYRPSRALDEFVRLRDLICRAPGCTRPAEHADIDHTVPWPAGPTHPGAVKCYCRIHHLVKTFHKGWSDRQLPDGTVVVTTPTGHTYTTKPGAKLFFPAWIVDTPAPPSAPVEDSPYRTLKMPRRQRTRSESRRDRITVERTQNAREGPIV